MLLIVGGESDPNTQRVVDQAHIRGLEYLFWDTDLDDAINVAWDFREPDIDLGSHRIRPTAVFKRWNVFGGESDRNLWVHDTIQAYTFAWPEVRILNRAVATDTNNKAFNLRLARAVGFVIPETMVMSNLAPLRTMPNASDKIAKPLAGGAHTRHVVDLAADDEAMMTSGPQFVQDNLAGENLRVFSVGGRLSCFHLATTALDYREDMSVGVIAREVPPVLIDPIHRLVAAKGFDYCALDFRCRSGFDEPVFLEVNSFPMFVRFDDAGENCLVNGLLDFLTTAT